MKKTILLYCILAGVLLCGCGNTGSDLGAATLTAPTAMPDGTAGAADISDTEPAGSTDTSDTGAASPSDAPASAEIPPGTPSPEPEEPEPPAGYTLLMVGDILLHTPVEESAKREDGSYNFDAIFMHTQEIIRSADLALVNQEVILGGTELGISGYPAFNAPYEAGDALVGAGFDIVCHATNHALDKGKNGILNCASYWRTAHPEITVLGIHDTEESQVSDPYIITLPDSDIRVAILNYTYGTNGIPLPGDMPYAVDLLDEKKVVADIRAAEEAADFTVVCPHWGTEYRLTPDSMQEKWTKIFLKNGVDLVLGTHPHVIEPVEWVTDEETGHKMLVYYSLGNFVNWTSGTGEGVANRMVGGMAEVTLTKASSGDNPDSIVISDHGVRALVCHVQPGQDGVTVYPLSDYPEELGDQNAIRSQDASFSKAYCVQLCDSVWGDLWQ